MKQLKFRPTSRFGIKYYISDQMDKFSIIEQDNQYKIRVFVDGKWRYPSNWGPNSFPSVEAAAEWLNSQDWSTITIDRVPEPSKWLTDVADAMMLLGFSCEESSSSKSVYTWNSSLGKDKEIQVTVNCQPDCLCTSADVLYKDSGLRRKLINTGLPAVCTDVAEFIKCAEALITRYNGSGIISSMMISATTDREKVITAGISTRDLAKNLVRVKSSNVWAYAINIKRNGDRFGDVLVQFKDKNGGPGDLYIYYEVPVLTYRRWISAPSKGHYFWRYIRNNFRYSKLTGDKRGKLPNAVN